MRNRMTRWAGGLLLLAACQSTPADAPPLLILVDSVRIQESESLYVGRPNAIALGPDGSVFISDIADRKIVRVARAGDAVIRVAGRGGGPGEVSSPTSLAILGDTVLAVQNAGGKRIEWFDLATLRYRNTLRLSSPASSLSSGSGALLIASLWPDSGTAFALLTDSSGALQRGGSVPEIYRRLPPVAQAFGTVAVARDGDAILGLFEVSNAMYRWPLRDGTADSILLTVATRRGARPDLIEALLRDPSKGASLAFQWSFPMLVAPLSDERAIVVFQDPTLVKDQYRGPSFVQMVDWRHHRSCAELALPVPADTPTRYAVRGDTLVAVVQHPSGDEGVSSWIMRWRIGASRC